MLIALLLLSSTPRTELAVVARLISPAASSTITLSDVQAAAFSAARWFVDVHLVDADEVGRALEEDLRECATDNRCIAARLSERRIDRALYVVVNREAGFATAELLGREQGTPLATEAVEIAGTIDSAVGAAVTGALGAAGHRRGARVIVEVVPQNALVRAKERVIVPGEPIVMAPGNQTIEATASGYDDERRELVLSPGEEVLVRLTLEPSSNVLSSWWLWTAIGVVVVAAIVIPVVLVRSGDDAPSMFCYGDGTLCERGP